MLIVDAEFYSFHCPQPKDVSFFGLKIISPGQKFSFSKKKIFQLKTKIMKTSEIPLSPSLLNINHQG